MQTVPDWQALRDTLRADGITLDDSTPRPVGGGDISAAWCATGSAGRFFIKTSARRNDAMFAAEKAGLDELNKARAVRVPGVLAQGATGSDSYLVLEWLDLTAPSAKSERDLGTKLALQHRVPAAAHGWHRDNTIGLTPQRNPETSSWASFYVHYRLGFQLELAAENGFAAELGSLRDAAMQSAQKLLENHQPVPSLLHGDLWGGNHAAIAGDAVIFDPAVYFGDRETDIAMTRLFGGFSSHFYAAYDEAWSMPAGSERRLGLYQLYHVLNHVNLFGRAYLGRAQAMLQDLVSVSPR